MTKIHSLSYSHSTNLGDEIQTIAAANLLKQAGFELGGFLDRNTFKTTAQCNVLCNGFFEYAQLQLLFQDNINPIISNLHIAWNNVPHALSPELVAQFKAHAPIGCRDRYTMQILQGYGIDCFFNHCLTLTLPRREKEVKDGKIFLVGVDGFVPLPKSIRQSGKLQRLTHESGNIYCHDSKMRLAQELLDRYRNEAELVITSKLHCALPCLAMGVPVILLSNPNGKRMQLATEIIPIHPYFKGRLPLYSILGEAKQFSKNIIKKIFHHIQHRSYFKNTVDWHPQAPDIESLKAKIISDTTALISSKTSA